MNRKLGTCMAVAAVLALQACGDGTVPLDPSLAPPNRIDVAFLNSPTGTATKCMEDVVEAIDGTNAVPLNCTANDLNLFFTIPGAGQGLPLCLPGDPLPNLEVEAHFGSGAANRWDIGLWIRSDGSGVPNALRGDCRHWSLVPVGAEGDLTAPGGVRLSPFYNEDGDSCGDLNQNFETVLTGVELSGLICNDSDGDGQLDVGACVGYDNNGNQDHLCDDPVVAVGQTRPNTKAKCSCGPLNVPVNIGGKIIIEKQTNPDGDPTVFDFTSATAGLSGSLSDGQSYNAILEAGTYSVAETVPAGWNLTGLVCTDPSGGTSVNLGTATATIGLAAGETVTCVFTNTKQGSITVEKQTLPDGSGTSFSFAGEITASLSDGQSETKSVTPGTYQVTETVPAGWDLISIVCSDANSSGVVGTGVATFNVEAGESVTCVYTNRQRGSITVVKDAQNPDTDPQDFVFGASGTGVSNFDLDDDADPTLSNTQTFSNLVPGAFSFTENQQFSPDWTLTSINCVGGGNPQYGATGVALTLGPGEDITCTFVNERKAKLIVQKVVVGGGAQSFDFTRNPGGVSFSLVNGGSNDSGFSLAPDTYRVCELDLAVSWSATATVNGGAATLINPDFPEDFGNRCVDVPLTYGDAKTVVWTNTPPPGGDARTIGYWKNWSSCSGGNQYAKAQAAGMLDKTLDGNLPQTIGVLLVDTCAKGVNILNKSNLSGKKMASDAAYNLAAQLLAAQLNFSAGAGTCQAAIDAANAAQALLASINFNGTGNYLTSKTGGALYTQANDLAAILDAYNNNTLCP